MHVYRFVLLTVSCGAGLLADDSALRGKMSMSAYVSVYGISGEVTGGELRLSLEKQLLHLGINVLPHGDPPNYPVLNLKIDAKINTETHTDTSRMERGRIVRGSGIASTSVTVDYTDTIELHEAGNVVVWSKTTGPQRIDALASWTIPDKALGLAIDFAKAWRAVNGRHPAVSDKTPQRLSLAAVAGQAGVPLSAPVGECDNRTAGGCVWPVSFGSVAGTKGQSDIPGPQRDMVLGEIERLGKAGRQVIHCLYGPANRQDNTGFATFHFWFKSVPPDILDLLTSSYNHPLMVEGRVAVDTCPATKTQADYIYSHRLN